MSIKQLILLFILSIFILGLSTCDLRANHSVQGYVESENLYISSSLSGTLVNLPVVRGALVQQGDLIFQLDSNPQSLKISEVRKVLEQEEALLNDLKSPKRRPEIGVARAQIDQIKARLRLAKLRMKRFRLLYERKAGNLDEADAALERFKELQSTKKQKEFELEFAKLGARTGKIIAQKAKIKSVKAREELFEWELNQKTKYAPDSGVVFDTFFVEGEWVPAGKPVAALLVPNYIWVEFFVPVQYLSKLKAGKTLYATCAGCSSKNKITIEYISPEAEYVPPLVYSRDNYDKLVFRIKARPENPALFKPGQPVTVTGF
ncbi:MAG: HlyD family efflux transporter periplasmic adaptor subunit [Legionellaceae bacterium]|nr:HlyD family efflux transporter periplasmic adaptor subunit [Legionellaceae bacterium]